jgi:ABC-2 type transport system permease protein
MAVITSIARRELRGYFATPLAYVFIVIFLVLTGLFTFYLGGFYERGQADLAPFFNFHPWLYLFLVPAIAMRLWSEERKSGSVELLMTLPVTLWQAVLAKFLAAWLFIAVALTLTFPNETGVNSPLALIVARPDGNNTHELFFNVAFEGVTEALI